MPRTTGHMHANPANCSLLSVASGESGCHTIASRTCAPRQAHARAHQSASTDKDSRRLDSLNGRMHTTMPSSACTQSCQCPCHGNCSSTPHAECRHSQPWPAHIRCRNMRAHEWQHARCRRMHALACHARTLPPHACARMPCTHAAAACTRSHAMHARCRRMHALACHARTLPPHACARMPRTHAAAACMRSHATHARCRRMHALACHVCDAHAPQRPADAAAGLAA
eukprot:365930-Chlamydomonas_euryale.AAC.2